MSCDLTRTAISARADGEPVDEVAIDRHLDGCEGCRSFAATVRQLRQELRIADVGPDFDITDRVLAEVGAQPPAPRRHRRGHRHSRHQNQHLLRRHQAAAAAVMVLAVTVWVIAVGAGVGPSSMFVTGGGGDHTPETSPARGDTGRPEIDELTVVWTRDELDPGVVEVLGPLATEMTVVRRETVGLTASWDDQGAPVDEPGDEPGSGWTIPLDVIAVDPTVYGPLMGSEPLTGLGQDEVLLGSSSAQLRGLGPGARLAFGDVELTVIGVVSDEAVGAAEAAVSTETGERLGVTTDRYAIVRIDELTAAAATPGVSDRDLRLADLIELGTDGEPPVRVRDAADTAYLRNSDAVRPQVEIKEAFGEFAVRARGDSFDVDNRWFTDSIVTTELPLIGQITCHRAVVPTLRAVMTELQDAGLEDAITPERFQGCWSPRNIRATGDLSRHTWGVAIDLRTDGLDPAVIEDEVRPVFEAHGFTWGGTWLTPDDGHFEYLTPDQ